MTYNVSSGTLSLYTTTTVLMVQAFSLVPCHRLQIVEACNLQPW